MRRGARPQINAVLHSLACYLHNAFYHGRYAACWQYPFDFSQRSSFETSPKYTTPALICHQLAVNRGGARPRALCHECVSLLSGGLPPGVAIGHRAINLLKISYEPC